MEVSDNEVEDLGVQNAIHNSLVAQEGLVVVYNNNSNNNNNIIIIIIMMMISHFMDCTVIPVMELTVLVFRMLLGSM